MKKTMLLLLFSAIQFAAFSQLKPVYSFWQDDSLLKKKYYEQALETQKALINSLDKEYKKEYKEIYEARFKGVAELLQSSTAVTAPEPQQYLQAILKKIIDANPELQSLQVRLIFSRDDWPNAYSMGEGTIAVNAGLFIFFDNESELVFALCHELAHYYLDHSNKAIKNNVVYVNSEEFKKEIKRISKQEYRFGQQVNQLMKKITFDSRKHNRDNEAEADQQAFIFMKRTGYDCNGIRTCLQMLDKADDSLIYPRLDLQKTFHFSEYRFKDKWIKKESVIFGEMSADDSPLTQKERDSLKTHPDCEKRIALLADSIQKLGAGKKFIVDEQLFRKLKRDFFTEMVEQSFRDDNITRNLYYNLLMLQNGDHEPLAIYSVARDLNMIYESQKNHKLGLITAKERRGFAADYNLLLRMIDRLKLDEIANLNYYFCKQYQSRMTGYAEFDKEISKAEKIKNNTN